MEYKYLEMLKQYMGMNNMQSYWSSNDPVRRIQPDEFYQNEIPKSEFDSETFVNSLLKYSSVAAIAAETLRGVLLNQQYIDLNTSFRNCLPASFFKPHEIHASEKRFEVTWERFHEYCKQHAFSVAKIINWNQQQDNSFDVIFIESGKFKNSMTPFIYIDSFRKYPAEYLKYPAQTMHMPDEVVHTFKNEHTGWSFCIVRTVTINAVQRVTSLPNHGQFGVDQNEIARIIKQFTDNLDDLDNPYTIY